MTAARNRQIILASRPCGEPTPDNFKLVETDVPEPGPGQMLLRTSYLSLDPYMRGRMNAGPSYAKPVETEHFGANVPARIRFVVPMVAIAAIVAANNSTSADEPQRIKYTKPGADGIPDYQPVAGWPRLPDTLQLGPVSAVAIDSADQVYVLQRANPPVLVFDLDGGFLRSWGEGTLRNPHGLRTEGESNEPHWVCVDHEGAVYAAYVGGRRVQKFMVK